MRQEGNGWGALSARGDTYAPGETVFGSIDGCPGTVVSVDTTAATFTVNWRDGKFPVVYPEDTIMIRKAWPWEL